MAFLRNANVYFSWNKIRSGPPPPKKKKRRFFFSLSSPPPPPMKRKKKKEEEDEEEGNGLLYLMQRRFHFLWYQQAINNAHILPPPPLPSPPRATFGPWPSQGPAKEVMADEDVLGAGHELIAGVVVAGQLSPHGQAEGQRSQHPARDTKSAARITATALRLGTRLYPRGAIR